jgi:uncharacterized RDD family membrane protein YckC
LDGLIAAFIGLGVGMSLVESKGLGAVAWTLAAISIYVLFSDALPNGQSLGKRVLGIAVVDAVSKRPCTAVKSFVRNITLVFLGIIDWVFIFGDKRQRLGDMLASTIVVTTAR